MKKKVLSMFLAAAMVFSLAACGGGDSASDNQGSDSQQEDTSGDEDQEPAGDENEGGEDVQGAADGGSADITLDGSWPEETVKIGFIGYDQTSEQQMATTAYFDYLCENFNIEIMYSEDLTDAQSELDFIGQCAAAGCKAVIGYYNEAKEQSAITAADYQMYYWGGFGGDQDAVDAAIAGAGEYYLGGYTLGDAEYEAGRSVALALAEQGCEKIVYCSGGASMGVPMFVSRKQGFEDGVKEAVEGGATMEIVYEVEGWPGTDAFTAAQTSVMDMDIDAIASSFDVAMWFQLVMESGKADSLKLACIGEVSDTYYDFFNNGLVSVIVYDNEEVSFGNAIPLILNAVSGTKLVDESGNGFLFPVGGRWTITTPEEYNAVYDLHDAGNWVVTAEDIANLIVAFNPDATTDTFKDFYGSFSIDSVK